VVDLNSVASARQLFQQLSDAMDGGDYDGWEAAIVEK